MRSRSSSRSKFYSHVRFSHPLTYTIASFSNTAAVIRHSTSLYHPVFPSQMVISTQPGSARSIRSCQKFSWHGIRKNVMCENSPLFQHRYFFDKFLVNNEFLQIHKRWYDHNEQFFKTVLHLGFFLPFKVLNIC